MEENKPIGADASGFDLLTEAMRSLLNQYPGLYDDEIVKFEELEKEYGIAFSADSGALIMNEKTSITDHVVQECQYPFFVVYRLDGRDELHKLDAQRFLDNMGKWLCKELVTVDNVAHQLKSYPSLSGDRHITRITVMNSYGIEPSEDGTQDWLLPVTVQYKKEFDRW